MGWDVKLAVYVGIMARGYLTGYYISCLFLDSPETGSNKKYTNSIVISDGENKENKPTDVVGISLSTPQLFLLTRFVDLFSEPF